MGRAFVSDKLAIDNNRAVWAVKAVHKIHEKICHEAITFFYLSLSAYILYNPAIIESQSLYYLYNQRGKLIKMQCIEIRSNIKT